MDCQKQNYSIYIKSMIKINRVFNNPSIKSFLFSMFIFGIAVGLYGGALNNFLAEILNIDRFGRGVVEFLREMPGLLLFAVLAILYRIPENRIIRIAFFIALLGMSGLVIALEARWAAVVLIVLWSTGEHLLMPVRQSIAIHSAIPGKEGVAMGLTRSAGNVGSVIGFYLVAVLFLGFNRLEQIPLFRLVFAFGALFCLAALLFTLRFKSGEGHVNRPRLMFRRKFFRYYILEMFFGARKQVFMTFAPYVLILNYGASTQLIASLYGIYSLANIFMNPVIGRLVDLLGYRKILIIDSVLLIMLCLLYGFAHHLFPVPIAYIIVCVVFVIDAMLFSAVIARAVYVRSLSSGQVELTGTLSTGISVNHFISIIIALAGGLLWEQFGMEVLFISAALFGLGSLLFTLALPKKI